MIRLAGLTATLSIVALGACTELPNEVPPSTDTTEGSDDPTTSSSGTITVPTPASTTGATGSTADSTTSQVSGADTTASSTSVGSTMTDADSTTVTPEPCDGVSCPSNQECDEADGQCVSVCAGGWGAGAYGGCLDPWGGVEITENCQDETDDATCITWDQPIQATSCSVQNCTTACDCPAPPGSGDAVVTCGAIVNDVNDCYLDCSHGEACPVGMTCREDEDDRSSVCVAEPDPLPMYGNCGNVGAACVDSQCVEFPQDDPTHAMCLRFCSEVGEDCDAAIPGSFNDAACDGVIVPPGGDECHIPCNNDVQCPSSMECVETDLFDNDRICMWPLEVEAASVSPTPGDMSASIGRLDPPPSPEDTGDTPGLRP